MESVFAIFVLMFMTLGVVQVALTLYARNVVMAAAHDGARAAVELTDAHMRAPEVARGVIQKSAGSLVDDLRIEERVIESTDRVTVTVVVSGRLSPGGPLPIEVPMSLEASASREVFDERT